MVSASRCNTPWLSRTENRGAFDKLGLYEGRKGQPYCHWLRAKPKEPTIFLALRLRDLRPHGVEIG